MNQGCQGDDNGIEAAHRDEGAAEFDPAVVVVRSGQKTFPPAIAPLGATGALAAWSRGPDYRDDQVLEMATTPAPAVAPTDPPNGDGDPPATTTDPGSTTTTDPGSTTPTGGDPSGPVTSTPTLPTEPAAPAGEPSGPVTLTPGVPAVTAAAAPAAPVAPAHRRRHARAPLPRPDGPRHTPRDGPRPPRPRRLRRPDGPGPHGVAQVRPAPRRSRQSPRAGKTLPAGARVTLTLR